MVFIQFIYKTEKIVYELRGWVKILQLKSLSRQTFLFKFCWNICTFIFVKFRKPFHTSFSGAILDILRCHLRLCVNLHLIPTHACFSVTFDFWIVQLLL